jgi:RNase adaptor protein for sRNA GlmZ degradation
MLAPVLIVTGLSGAGKTMALKTLEDLGCEVIDNLPLSLSASVVQEKGRLPVPLALGLDVRARDFDADVLLRSVEAMRSGSQKIYQSAPVELATGVFDDKTAGSLGHDLAALSTQNPGGLTTQAGPLPGGRSQSTSATINLQRIVKILFFDCQTEALAARYRETRRAHPLGSALDMRTIIAQEKALLEPLRRHATQVIDTTRLSPPELKSHLRNLLAKAHMPKPVGSGQTVLTQQPRNNAHPGSTSKPGSTQALPEWSLNDGQIDGRIDGPSSTLPDPNLTKGDTHPLGSIPVSSLQDTAKFLWPEAAPTIYLMSFAFRRGVPGGADTVFDVRFLPNPHYTDSLKLLTGKSREVQSFFQDMPAYLRFQNTCQELLDQLFEDPRASFVIAFGCSGGKHRSVFTAEHTAQLLRQQGYSCSVSHRDLH